MEALAARNLILWMPVLGASIGHAISEVGPDHARERWLQRIGAGETFLALAVTEPTAATTSFAPRRRCAGDGERFVIDGLKAVTSGSTWRSACSSSGRAPGDGRRATAVHHRARRSHGTRRVSVPSCRCAGARARASSSSPSSGSRLRRGTRGRRRPGAAHALALPRVERLMTAALALGNAPTAISARCDARRRAHDLRHAADRRRAGDPASARVLHARIAATRLLVYRAAERFDAGGTRRAWPVKQHGQAARGRARVRRCGPRDADSRRLGVGRARGDDRPLPRRTRRALGADLTGARAELHRPARARAALATAERPRAPFPSRR